MAFGGLPLAIHLPARVVSYLQLLTDPPKQDQNQIYIEGRKERLDLSPVSNNRQHGNSAISVPGDCSKQRNSLCKDCFFL